MKIFKVEYYGGLAFVVAENKEDALLKVMYHHKTKDFNGICIEQINYLDGDPGPVFHNDTGDY